MESEKDRTQNPGQGYLRRSTEWRCRKQSLFLRRKCKKKASEYRERQHYVKSTQRKEKKAKGLWDVNVGKRSKKKITSRTRILTQWQSAPKIGQFISVLPNGVDNDAIETFAYDKDS